MGRSNDQPRWRWRVIGTLFGVLAVGFATALDIWVVPYSLIRCHLAAENYYPLPDNCSALDVISDTATFFLVSLLGFALAGCVFLGVVWIVQRFRAPPGDS